MSDTPGWPGHPVCFPAHQPSPPLPCPSPPWPSRPQKKPTSDSPTSSPSLAVSNYCLVVNFLIFLLQSTHFLKTFMYLQRQFPITPINGKAAERGSCKANTMKITERLTRKCCAKALRPLPEGAEQGLRSYRHTGTHRALP